MNVKASSQHFCARPVSLLTGLVLMLAAATTASADEIFMKIGGQAATMNTTQGAPTLAGESTDSQYPSWVPVLSLTHGMSRSVTVGGVSSVTAHDPVGISKPADKTSPSINLLVNGATATVSQPIDFVTIDFRRTTTNNTTQVYYRIELQGVFVSSATVRSSADTPMESVTLLYRQIKWSYLPYDSNGKAQSVISKGWDLTNNKAF